MEYQIVDAETLGVLEDKVQRLIAEGWRPQGGVATRTWLESMSRADSLDTYESRSEPRFYQAMVREL